VKPALAASLLLGLAAALAACRGGDKTSTKAVTPEAPQDGAAVPAAGATDDAASQPPEAETVAKASVTLYFPSAAGNTLMEETREIVETKQPADRGAQILAALLDGPQSDEALPAVPEGTMLRRLWVERDGDAYADFSEELASGISGGSADEILTIFAIIDSLTANVPEIRRVGILVAGRERDTLGHLDLRRPLLPDLSLATSGKDTE
jgi:spore germination protein GerM